MHAWSILLIQSDVKMSYKLVCNKRYFLTCEWMILPYLGKHFEWNDFKCYVVLNGIILTSIIWNYCKQIIGLWRVEHIFVVSVAWIMRFKLEDQCATGCVLGNRNCSWEIQESIFNKKENITFNSLTLTVLKYNRNSFLIESEMRNSFSKQHSGGPRLSNTVLTMATWYVFLLLYSTYWH